MGGQQWAASCQGVTDSFGSALYLRSQHLALKNGTLLSPSLSSSGGGGVTKYFSWYGDVPFLGVLFQTVTELWVSFSQFLDI